MERSGEEERQNEKERKENENPKVKSCIGVVYYSSILKSQDRNPRCIGIPGSHPQVGRIVEQHGAMKWDHMGLKLKRRGHALNDFRYACAGYSVYMSRNKGAVDKEGDSPDLPGCAGIQVVGRREIPRAATASAPAHVHSREDRDICRPPTHKPTHAAGGDFLNRFANLVASGVARNVRRVGNYMKETVDDILFPNRK